jgi:hypothetical protein
MNEWQVQLQEDLNQSADQDLGTVVAVCDGMGRYDDGSLLEVCELRYHVADDTWNPQIVTASLMTDPLLLTTVQQSDVAEPLLDTLKQLHDDDTMSIHSVAIRPKRVPPSWRQGRIEARLSDVGPNTRPPIAPCPRPTPARIDSTFTLTASYACTRRWSVLSKGARQKRPSESCQVPASGPLSAPSGRTSLSPTEGGSGLSRSTAPSQRDQSLAGS